MKRGQMASLIEIQKFDYHKKEWLPVELKNIREENSIIVVGGPFRIMVNEEEIYREGSL
jgi:hypothetical protein